MVIRIPLYSVLSTNGKLHLDYHFLIDDQPFLETLQSSGNPGLTGQRAGESIVMLHEDYESSIATSSLTPKAWSREDFGVGFTVQHRHAEHEEIVLQKLVIDLSTTSSCVRMCDEGHAPT